MSRDTLYQYQRIFNRIKNRARANKPLTMSGKEVKLLHEAVEGLAERIDRLTGRNHWWQLWRPKR